MFNKLWWRQDPASFHKFHEIDPIDVYETYFKESDEYFRQIKAEAAAERAAKAEPADVAARDELWWSVLCLGEGKTTSLLSASYRRLRRWKLVESIEDFCFLRGKCTKLGGMH